MAHIKATIDYNLKEGVTLEQVLSLLEQGHPNAEYIAKAIQQSLDEGYVDNISLLSDDVDAWLYIDDGDVAIGLNGDFTLSQSKWINEVLTGNFIEQTASKPFTYEMTCDLEEMSVDVLPHFETYGDLTKMLDDQEIEKAKENILASIQFLQQAAINRNVDFRELVGVDFSDSVAINALGDNRSVMVYTTSDVKKEAPDLNVEQANYILDTACRHHDSELGINSYVLRNEIERNLPSKRQESILSYTDEFGDKVSVVGFVDRRNGEIFSNGLDDNVESLTVRLRGSIIEASCESIDVVKYDSDELIEWTEKPEEEKSMTYAHRMQVAQENGYDDVIDALKTAKGIIKEVDASGIDIQVDNTRGWLLPIPLENANEKFSVGDRVVVSLKGDDVQVKLDKKEIER